MALSYQKDGQWVQVGSQSDVFALQGLTPTLAWEPISGRFLAPAMPFDSRSTASLRMFLHPVFVPKPTTFDRVAFRITVAGGAGHLIKVGVYADDGYKPGALIADFGDVDGATVVNPALLTINQQLSGLVWMAALPNNVSPQPTVFGGGNFGEPLWLRTSYTNTPGILTNTLSTFALPSDMSVVAYGVSNNGPLMWLRCA